MTAPPLVVVGGAYYETVRETGVRRLMGSGVRAAALLAGWGGEVELRTRTDERSGPEARAVAAAAGVRLSAEERSSAVGFDYETGLSAPRVRAALAAGPPLRAAGTTAVAFGMVEGPWELDADTVVIDAQHAPLAAAGLRRGAHRRAALVVSRRELHALVGAAGPMTDVEAARRVAPHGPFDAVVVKCGCRGALVVEDGAEHWVPASPTAKVDPIGTGDAFTAGFAQAWAVLGQPAAQAAAAAGAVTAWHASGHALHVPSQALDGALPDGAAAGTWGPDAAARVYLAGPFFTMAQRWLVDTARAGLLDIGAEPFSPWHEVGEGPPDVVAPADLAGLDVSGSVLALLDGGDPGTLFECGWAARAGTAVVGLAGDPTAHDWTMLVGTGARVHSDLPTAAYQAAWAALAAEAAG